MGIIGPELLTNLLAEESSLDWLFDNQYLGCSNLEAKGGPSTAPGLEDRYHLVVVLKFATRLLEG